MTLTLDTSHLEISPLKKFAYENMWLMSVTLKTSHSPICPYGPFRQSPFGESLRHASTDLLSSTLNCGRNSGRDWGSEGLSLFKHLEKLKGRETVLEWKRDRTSLGKIRYVSSTHHDKGWARC